ncbi:MAG: hypothetical protein ACT4TC_26620 [Myxococcaceae bacterium]
MKNAFHVNLPKVNPKLKSAVSALVSPPNGAQGAGHGNGIGEGADHEARVQLNSRRPTIPAAPVLKFNPARGMTQPINEAHRAWFEMLGELEGHVNRAAQARSRLRGDGDAAKALLAKTTNEAVEALHQLATVEKQLHDRSNALNSLLSEIEQLRDTRSNALSLARRLARIDRRTFA